jgi:hypothetical protein
MPILLVFLGESGGKQNSWGFYSGYQYFSEHLPTLLLRHYFLALAPRLLSSDEVL